MTVRLDQESPRYDARAKVTGEARYTEDLPMPPGGVYGRVLLSPFAHARIRAIDTTEAEAVPGVLALLTGERLAGDVASRHASPGARSGADLQPFLAIGKVRFAGEPVVAVAAESLAAADQALRLVDVDYEELPEVFDAREAIKPGAPLVHEARGNNIVGEYVVDDWGDVEQGFQEADRVIEETFTTPSLFHHPMENLGTCLAEYLDGEVTLTAPIQQIFGARAEVAEAFGLDPERVRITMPYIGGGFGGKELKPSMLCALWLSRHLSRPVKMVPTAEESFRNDARHAVHFTAKTGVKLDGTITAVDVKILADAGAYAKVGMGAARMVALSSWGPYRVPNLRVRSVCVYTNRVPAGYMRGVGKVQAGLGLRVEHGRGSPEHRHVAARLSAQERAAPGRRVREGGDTPRLGLSGHAAPHARRHGVGRPIARRASALHRRPKGARTRARGRAAARPLRRRADLRAGHSEPSRHRYHNPGRSGDRRRGLHRAVTGRVERPRHPGVPDPHR